MYEHFKNKLALSLSSTMSPDDVSIVLQKLDIVAYDYDITEKRTELVPYNTELPEMVKMYLVSKSIEGLSHETLNNYRLTLHKFFKMVQKAPEQITTNDIRVYLYRYQESTKVTNRSLDKIRQTICTFFTWAHNEGYLDKNPAQTIKPIKYEVKPRQSLSQIELEYIRQACITPKEKAMVEFMYSTGCRVSEMAIVKKSDIDWDKKTVHLLGKGSKHRTSYINAKAEIALLNYFSSREDTSDYVFVSDRKPHNPMHKDGLEKIVRILRQRASEHVNKPITPHTFRHTTCSVALQNGMPVEEVSKLLGHANLATTMIYAHISHDEVQYHHMKCVI